jgi:hypothetical protein
MTTVGNPSVAVGPAGTTALEATVAVVGCAAQAARDNKNETGKINRNKRFIDFSSFSELFQKSSYRNCL